MAQRSPRVSSMADRCLMPCSGCGKGSPRWPNAATPAEGTAGGRRHAVEQAETKASVLQKALRSIKINGAVKIDELLGEASIIDVIRLLCPEASGEYAVQMFTRILEKDDRVKSIESRIKNIKMNGCGRTTPVADLDTLVEVLWMLPSVASRALRRESVEAVFRAMRGGLGLRRQIEQNNLV